MAVINIAAGKTATASSFVKPYAPANLVNGNYTTQVSRWLCNSVSASTPAWVQVDLGAPCFVNRWVVRHMPVAGWKTPDYCMSDFRLVASNDLTNWTNIDGVTGNVLSITDRTVVPVTFRYFRVIVTKGLNTNPQLASFMELEIYTAPPGAYLSNLALSSGTLAPVFSPTTITYSAAVAYGTSSITVTPTAMDPAAVIKVNDVQVTSGQASGPISLNVGNNAITVNVTAGTTTQVYTVNVLRASPNLTNLVIGDGTATPRPLTPVFASGTTSYSTNVANETTSITVTPTAEDATAVITVNGTRVTSGSAATVSNLVVGTNTVTVTVTPAVGTAQTYTVTVNKLAQGPYLDNLVLGYTGGTGDTLTFDKYVTSYTVTCDIGITLVMVTPTFSGAGYSVTVNGGTPVASGATKPVNFSKSNVSISIPVVVTSGGISRTYTILVNRRT
jgi:hypothetical protein